MPDVSLPTGAVRAPKGPRNGPGFSRRGRGRGGQGQFVAHDIEAKSRTHLFLVHQILIESPSISSISW